MHESDECGKREIERSQATILVPPRKIASPGGLLRPGFRVSVEVRTVRHGADENRAKAIEPVGPDEFEERVDEDHHQEQDFHLPLETGRLADEG